MPAFASQLNEPPRTRGKPKTKKNPRAVAAGAWVMAGISIVKPGPPAKIFTKRFDNPLVYVDIRSGEVIAFRWPAWPE